MSHYAEVIAELSGPTQSLREAYKRCRDYLDAAIELVRPGGTTSEIAAAFPNRAVP